MTHNIMQNPDLNHDNHPDKLAKAKLSLTSPVYKDLDFGGKPNNKNQQKPKKKANHEPFGNDSGYPYNEMQFQLNYMPYYHHQMQPHNFVNSHDSHNQNHERNFSYNKIPNERPENVNNNPSKPANKNKPDVKEGVNAQNKEKNFSYNKIPNESVNKNPPKSANQSKPHVKEGGNVQNKAPAIKKEDKKEQNQAQTQNGESTKKKKKKNKNKDKEPKEDFSNNPWAQPLKKALKKIAAAAAADVKNVKQVKIETKKAEPKEENKTESEEKKFKFLRVRDIRKRYYANKPFKPEDRVSQLRARDIIDKKRKKKLSKVKKAKLRYLELQLLNVKRAQMLENLKNKDKESEDGYETVDENAEEDNEKEVTKPIKSREPKGKFKEESKKEREESPEEGSVEKKKEGEKPEEKKIEIEKYIPAIPELAIPDEKRPQTMYKELKVRRWVDHILCEEVDRLAFDLLNDLLRMQTIKKLIKPTKSKKRILCGMREVLRSINTPLADQAARCIVIAINIQENPLQQGGDEKMLEIIVRARNKKIPIIHACSRKQLGQACTGNDFARISVVSVTNYFGADDMYKDLLELVEEKRKEFQDQVGLNVE